MESDYSKSMHCIFMIFTELLYGMHGYILLQFNLICMRIDEATGTGTYKYHRIFSYLSTRDTYTEEIRHFILPRTEINYQTRFKKSSDIFSCYLQDS